MNKAADFTSGQAARAVAGQYEFTYADDVPNQQVVGAVGGLAWANGTLFVADSSPLGTFPAAPNAPSNGPITVNNRVLQFDTTKLPSANSDLSTITPFDSFNCNVCGYSAYNVLGQPDFNTTQPNYPVPANQTYGTPTQSNLRAASGVASDGHILAVADTGNNRVLIWNSIPTTIDAPANIVLGQPSFTQNPPIVSIPPTASSLRAPQGVWIQNGKLFVADTQDNRVLIWNSIPTSNNQPADLVLGQPSFTSNNAPPPQNTNPTTAANQLLDPTSVTSDGTRVFVADHGFNRVLIWNSIPTSMDQPADVVVGQPVMTTSVPDWTTTFCPSISTTTNGSPCAGTLDAPSYALSDGTRLFIADQGNDRVLIFNSIPTQNGASADIVLGQPNMTANVITSQAISIASTAIDNTAGVDLTEGPTSLAYDGTNLYVSDPYNLRVLVFTPGDVSLPDNSVVNWASEIIRQEGAVTLSGTIAASEVETITINGTAYTYTVKSGDTLDTVAQGLVSAVNSGSGDPNATAIFAGAGTATVFLSSKGINLAYDSISLSFTGDSAGDITGITSGAYLSAGTAATAAPGMLVEIDGSNFSDNSAPVVAPLSGNIPTKLGEVQVFMDGIAAPIYRASDVQIITQIPFSFTDRNSTSIYVRTTHNDGSITVTNATPMYIAPANPGLFAAPVVPGQSPVLRPATAAFHQPGNAEAVIDFEGTITAGNTATITVNGRNYTYAVVSTDTLTSITQALVNLINAAPDPQVSASVGAAFNRVVLTAKQAGAAGTGIPVSTSTSANATVSLTAYTGTTCCNVTPGSAITASNPAVPGEVINISAAGLGTITDPTNTAGASTFAGAPYNGPVPNTANNSVSATMGGSTAQVIAAGLPTGSYGVYQVQMIVPSSLSSNASTELYIAQNAYISNLVTIPVGPAAQVVGSGGSGNSLFNSGITFTANPNPIPPNANGLGNTTITWAGAPGYISLWEGSPENGGGQIALGHISGMMNVTNVADGTTFYLQDQGNPSPLSSAATLATVTVHVLSGIMIHMDSPTSSGSYSGVAHFNGWAIDPITAIASVTVRIDGASTGSAAYGGSRPDVCGAGADPGCPNVGWDFYFDTTPLANGSHTFEVTVQTAGGKRLSQAASFTVSNSTASTGTVAFIDSPNARTGPVQGSVSFAGWAINPNAAITSVAILIDGAPYGNASYNVSRSDVCNSFPGAPGCPIVGWSIPVDTNTLSNGLHAIEAVATAANGQAGAASTTLNVANWTTANPMTISIGSPNPQGPPYSGTVVFGGFAVDMNAAISGITLSIDGVPYGNAAYGGSRPDACASFNYPGCPNVGWSAVVDTTQLADGAHTLAVTGTTVDGVSSTRAVTFAVANFNRANPLHMHIDTPSGPNATFSGTAPFGGWAVSDNASIKSVEILVDGVAAGFAQYGANRADVCAAYPGRAGCPNVGWTFNLDTMLLTNGVHTVEARALSSTGEYGTAGSSFTVSNSFANSPVEIDIDQPAGDSSPYEGIAQFSGWAIDKNATISTVAISIDGVPFGIATYGIARADVCPGLPGVPGCPNIGWSISVDTTHLPDGLHVIGITATASNGDFGVASWVFTVANWSTQGALHLAIDSPNPQNPPYFGTVNFGGWALDLDAPVTSVQVAVDGTPLGAATYGIARSDACAAYKNPPGCPNVGWSLPVDTTQFPNGTHSVAVTAISASGQRTTLSGTFVTDN